MNLINDLNNRVVSKKNLVESFYRKIRSEIVSSTPNEDEFLKLTSQAKFKYIDYKEYCEIIRLQEEVKQLRMQNNMWKANNEEKKIEVLMNKFLVRAIANDMYSNDCEHITDDNYMFLGNLGYACDDDKFIPEIVRRNFVLFAKRDYLRRQIESCCEVVDRLNLALKDYLGIVVDKNGNIVRAPSSMNDAEQRKSIDKLKSNSFDEKTASIYFDQMSLPLIRKKIGKYKCPQLSNEELTNLLYDYDDKVFDRIFSSNVLGKKSKDEIISNLMTESPTENLSLEDIISQTEKKYDELGMSAFNPKDEGNVLVKSGYENFRFIKVYEVIKEKRLEYIRRAYDEVRLRLPRSKRFFDSESPTPTSMCRNVMYQENNLGPITGLYAEIDYAVSKLEYKIYKSKEYAEMFEEARVLRDKCRKVPEYHPAVHKYPNRVRGMRDVDDLDK